MGPGKKSPKSSPKKQAKPAKSESTETAELKSNAKVDKKSSLSDNRKKVIDSRKTSASIPQDTDAAAAATALESLSIENNPEPAAEGEAPATEGGDGEEKAEGEEEEETLPLPWEYNRCLNSVLETLASQYFVSEHEKAIEMFELLEGIVNEEGKWNTTRELLDRVMTVNAEIATKYPHETTPRNVIYRFRKMILEEYITAVKELQPSPDIGSARNFFESIAVHNEVVNMDMPNIPEGIDVEAVVGKVKASTIAAVMEYRTEIDNIPNVIAQKGNVLITEGDAIMTYAFCPITALFFLNAAEHCSFTLYVVESQPLCYGHMMAEQLEDSGVEVIMIPDCNVGTLISSMTKVIIPCVAVLYDGSLKTISLGGVIAIMAALHKKQLFAVAASYQFTGSAIPNVNVSLDPHLIDSTPFPDVIYVSKKFDTVDGSEVFRIISNPVVITVSQASRRITELYTPRLEKDDEL